MFFWQSKTSVLSLAFHGDRVYRGWPVLGLAFLFEVKITLFYLFIHPLQIPKSQEEIYQL